MAVLEYFSENFLEADQQTLGLLVVGNPVQKFPVIFFLLVALNLNIFDFLSTIFGFLPTIFDKLSMSLTIFFLLTHPGGVPDEFLLIGFVVPEHADAVEEEFIDEEGVGEEIGVAVDVGKDGSEEEVVLAGKENLF